MTTNKKRSGFTLIELLVVVAIIAIIGAGVAVTYSRLDERAKNAVEANDIAVLSETIKHWTFLHDGKLPNGLDSLITTDGDLYSAMSDNNGLYAHAGCTFEAVKANSSVKNALATTTDTHSYGGGLTFVYLHDKDTAIANNSTFVSSTGGRTRATLTENLATMLESTKTSMATKFTAMDGAKDTALGTDYLGHVETDADTGEDTASPIAYTLTWGSGMSLQSKSYKTIAQWTTDYNEAKKVSEAEVIDKLAFIYPGGGLTYMNYTEEIISYLGLTDDDVALPTEDATEAALNGRKYWLVGFGLGRFAEIYQGTGAHVDAPATGKRYTDSNIYSHYLVVIKVPVDLKSATNLSGQISTIGCVLSPQAMPVALLKAKYDAAVEATSN